MGSNYPLGLTIRETAARLGISENAVRKQIQRGKLDAAKIDGIWYVALPPDAHDEINLVASFDDLDSIAQLQRQIKQQLAEIAFLRSELAARRDAEHELRVIIVQISERLPRLPAKIDSTPVPWWQFWHHN